MDSYGVHVAVAALLGASIVAVSAYIMHRRTLNHLMHFAKSIENKIDNNNNNTNNTYNNGDDEEEEVELPPVVTVQRKGNRQYRRSATSLPDVTRYSGNGEVEEKRNGQLHVDFGASAFSRLRSMPAGKYGNGTPSKRPGLPPRSMSLKTSAASATACVEDSDEEDNLASTGKLETPYIQMNGNANPQEHVNANAEKVAGAAPKMVRTLSIAGDVHSVQPDPVAADILRKEPEQETFVRLKISPSVSPSPEEAEVYLNLQVCLEMRENYVFREDVAPWEKEVIADPSTPKRNPNPFDYALDGKSDHHFQMEDGVVQVYAHKDSTEKLFHAADATTFFTDLHHILKVIADGNNRTVCHHRLVLLEQKFNLHLMLNADSEFLAQKSAPHRDFYNVRKVDTHVHHSACMNQKHLLRFIKSKLKKEPDEVVIFRDGTYMTLKEVFESLDLTGNDLNVDLLDVHADQSTFHRFDKFNLKYNPCGQSRLREIFLKQDNLIQGRFLGELTKQVFSDLEASKYQMAEYRISIYGRKMSEWDQLASWIINNDLYSENVVWLIQLPRLYNVYKGMGIVSSFQNILDNIFLPLFEVTVNPESHPQLHVFLKQVVGFDLVDDESKPERRPTKHMPTPAQWDNIYNPAFAYYIYYCYANLYMLNKLRESKGMNTINLRPHAGEAGDVDHLAATFLTSHSISHGINLRKSPVLQYLYYLGQIGLAMSPLSNNSLFLDYSRNPLPVFFQRGLNVSLSTDDPLQIHLTKEPLVEEYSIAASVWKLSSCDMCEIARNSVFQSGFSHALKSHWIGKEYYKRGPEGNDIRKTNVPHIRVEFRDMIWREEMRQIYLGEAMIPQYIDP